MKLAVLATESDAGKTHIVGALSYIFRNKNPFPFKAQNMSLNAYLSKDEGEMAFAQAYQSMCAGRTPTYNMNPVLLKPMAKHISEVIIFGKSIGKISAKEYWKKKKSEIKGMVFEMFSEILKREKAVFVEGAGSCTEINLKENDFANLELCKRFEIPFVVVSDIEKGGVFAKIIGTYELLEKKEKELLVGFIINKFRGEKSILSEGVKFIERKTEKKVLGIIPYGNFNLPEEDSLGFRRKKSNNFLQDYEDINEIEKKEGEIRRKIWKLKGIKEGESQMIEAVGDKILEEEPESRKIKVRVVKTPYLSNFFDFYPFMLEDCVDFDFAYSPDEIENADLIILGGSRNVFYDLVFLKKSGFASAIKNLKEKIEAGKKKSLIFGICGGFEMMFEEIKDDGKIEVETGKIEGLGFIKGKVVFQKGKITCWQKLKVETPWFSGEIEGFNIRHGVSVPEITFISERAFCGTFLHNIFFSDDFRKSILNFFGAEKINNFQEKFEKEIKKWAEHVKKNSYITEIVKSNY